MRKTGMVAAVMLIALAGCERSGGESEAKPVSGPAPTAPPAPAANAAVPAQEPTGVLQADADAVDQGFGRELPEGSGKLDFLVLNRTGQTIADLHLSPAGEESWGEDRLSYDALSEGERAAISFERDLEMCFWDLRVTYEGGQQRSWPRVNLCDSARVELR